MVKLGLLLAVGSLVNVFVALSCVGKQPPSVNAADFDAPGWKKRWLIKHGWKEKPGAVVTCNFVEQFGAGWYFFDELPRNYTGPPRTFAYCIRSGWPFSTLCYERVELEPSADLAALPWSTQVWITQNLPQTNMIGTPVTTGSRSTSGGGLSRWPEAPRRPIWAGFIANTVFYAFLMWAIWSLHYLIGIRSRSRLKVGLCPQCGYDLREEGKVRARYLLKRGCPECGWNRPDKL